MKKVLAPMIALLMLLLCACGQETAPAQSEQEAAQTQQDQTAEDKQGQTAETNADGYYVKEGTSQDGSTYTAYYVGGPEGTLAKVVCDYVDGAYSEELYNAEGKLEFMIVTEVDGTIFESYFYPSGSISKDIIKLTDGSYSELHYLDDGVIDKDTGMVSSGTVCYEKYVTADGKVEEYTYDITKEEDGTHWNTEEWEDGTIVKTHYGTNGNPIEQTMNNEQTGDHTEITYYENGREKTRDSYHAGSKQRVYLEYYENNSVKYSLIEGDNGSKNEEKINVAGYTTYYFENFNNTKDTEFFANDTGELVKYVENGTVYEGDAIPGTARDMFNQVRKTPAPTVEDTATTQEADGSTHTTSTLSDGTVETRHNAADGRTISNDRVSPNGDRSYQEYFESGKLKVNIEVRDGTFQEVHYDEDDYWTYFHYTAPGYEMEVICDETGKVNKVLVNGVEQTDIESYVKDMFFRSW